MEITLNSLDQTLISVTEVEHQDLCQIVAHVRSNWEHYDVYTGASTDEVDRLVRDVGSLKHGLINLTPASISTLFQVFSSLTALAFNSERVGGIADEQFLRLAENVDVISIRSLHFTTNG